MNAELRCLNERFRQKGLRILPLRWVDDHALLYLYRPKLLERDLRDPLAGKLLSECGYDCEDIHARLGRLITRMRTEAVFPHEVGLFLGYPPADVDGFIIGDNDFTDGLKQCDVAECGGLVVGGAFGGTVSRCTASGRIIAEGNEPVGLGGIAGCLEMMNDASDNTVDWSRGRHGRCCWSACRRSW